MDITNEKLYKNLPNDQLIIYALLSIKRKGEEATFERLVKECYSLFPKSFSFFRYPEWPDSLKLDRQLRDLRKKRLISGNNQSRFDLTSIGERYVLQVEKNLNRLEENVLIKIKPIKGRKENRLFDHLKNSNLYKDYLSKKLAITVPPTIIKPLLFGTLETPNSVILKNIDHLKTLASEAGEENLINFLNFCKRQINDKQ